MTVSELTQGSRPARMEEWPTALGTSCCGCGPPALCSLAAPVHPVAGVMHRGQLGRTSHWVEEEPGPERASPGQGLGIQASQDRPSSEARPLPTSATLQGLRPEDGAQKPGPPREGAPSLWLGWPRELQERGQRGHTIPFLLDRLLLECSGFQEAVSLSGPN